MSDLWRLSACEIAGQVRRREVSAVEVTQAALDRMSAVNAGINAVVCSCADEALESARDLDKRLADGNDPGMLSGVPVTVKENIDQAGYATTNGLRIQKDLIAESDSPVVSNFRRAGAVIVGRTNTPAFSLRWFTRNSLHGHTLNPRNSKITPGGSSGGAAAAVTAGIGAIAHGTDIGGSIRYPAYACGVHGLRPSFGRVPAWNSSGPERHLGAQLMAVSGPIARTVDDIELALQAMSRPDWRDPWWVPAAIQSAPYPRRAALCAAPDGLRTDAAVAAALSDAAERLRDAGWVVDERDCPGFREAAERQLLFWMSEYQMGGAEAVEKEGDEDAEFVYRQLIRRCDPPDLSAFLRACQDRLSLIREWQSFLADYPLLLCPVSAEPPFPDLLDVESEAAFDRILEAQLPQLGLPFLGLPGLTVSTTMAEDVPIGVQLISGRFREDILITAGREIETRGAPPSPVDPV